MFPLSADYHTGFSESSCALLWTLYLIASISLFTVPWFVQHRQKVYKFLIGWFYCLPNVQTHGMGVEEEEDGESGYKCGLMLWEILFYYSRLILESIRISKSTAYTLQAGRGTSGSQEEFSW